MGIGPNVASRLSCGDSCGGEAECFHDRVVNRGADFGNFVIVARGIHAIGQEDGKELAVRVDPDGRASEASVSVAVRGEIVAAGTVFGGNHPTQCAFVLGEWLRDGEFGDRRAF